MRVSCPSCNAESSLEVLLGREVDARAVAAFVERNLAFGELLLRYIALFRPAQRRLGIARMVGLLEEIRPDIERAAITRKGRDWAAPHDAWKAGIEAIFAKRDKGTLTLPLTGHGLLYEVICNVAEKAEAQAEARREQDRRDRRTPGPRDPGPRNLADMADHLAHSPVPAAEGPARAVVVAPVYSGPSRAALAIQAEIAERRRTQTPASTPTPSEVKP